MYSSRSRSGREVILAKITLAIVFTSILIHSVKWVPTIYEFIDVKGYETSTWILSFEHVSHFLLVVDSSINFYIYTFTRSKTFLSKLTRRLSNQSFKHTRKSSPGKSSKPYQYSICIGPQNGRSEMTRQDTMIVKQVLSIDVQGERWQ